MKSLEAFTKRRTDRAILAKSAIKVCRGNDLIQATENINKTSFSAKDVRYWAPILVQADVV